MICAGISDRRIVSLGMVIFALLFIAADLFFRKTANFLSVCLIFAILFYTVLIVRLYTRNFGPKNALRNLLINPADMAIVALSLFYGLSFFSLYFVSAENLEFARLRPYVYDAISNVFALSAAIVLLGISVITFFRGAVVNSISEINNSPIDYNRAFVFLALIYSISLFIKIFAYSRGVVVFSGEIGYGQVFGSFASIASIFEGYSLYLPASFLVFYFQSKLKKFLFVALAAVIFESIFGVIFAQKIRIFAPALTSILVVLFYSDKVPLLRIFSYFCIATPLFIGAVGARLATIQGIDISDVGAFAFFSESLRLGFAGGSSYGTDGGTSLWGYLLSRANFSIPLATAVELRDSGFSGHNFSNYLNAVLSLVPSFVFPWKPLPMDQNEFGRLVGLIHPDDYLTSIRPSYFGDFVYNGGFFAFPLLTCLFGLALRAISLVRLSSATMVFIFYASYVFLDIENSISNVLGGCVKFFLLIYFLRIYARRDAATKVSPIFGV